jgi:hypothetical protein
MTTIMTHHQKGAIDVLKRLGWILHDRRRIKAHYTYILLSHSGRQTAEISADNIKFSNTGNNNC